MRAVCCLCQKRAHMADDESMLCMECERRVIPRDRILRHSEEHGFMHLSTQAMTMLAQARLIEVLLKELEEERSR